MAGWSEDGQSLPNQLSERYKLIRRLEVRASQADLFLVRELATGAEVVLKHYRNDRTPDPALTLYLSGQRDHTVRYLEFGPGYEVMEYLPAGGLLEWREANPAGFSFTALHEITQQIAAALITLHRQGLVHRDVKPANIMFRTVEPRDMAIVDFGIAGLINEPDPDVRPNPAYQPPEWIFDGRFGVAGDWWSLGMTILELAAGWHPFADLPAEDIRGHFVNGRTIPVDAVPDEPEPNGLGQRRDRLRSLCQGLLALDRNRRWGEREVSDWIVGHDPEVPGVVPHTPAAAEPMATHPAGSDARTPGNVEQIGAERPFEFNRLNYHFRDELAQDLATAWDYAVESVVLRHGRLERLHDWLGQFPDDEASEARQVVQQVSQDTEMPGHVRLLRVLRALDPTRPATYRHYAISRRNLELIAHRALQNDGDAMAVLSDLWRYHLLPTFDTAIPAMTAMGGEALADLDREWRTERRRWRVAANQVADPGARDYLDLPRTRLDLRAVSLRAALHRPDDVVAVHDQVRITEAQLPVAVPWFSALARRPEQVWVAFVLCAYAMSQARTEHDRRTARVAQAEARRANAVFREWSRRQNRPVALGWAVAGLCLIAVVWIALIEGSDAVGWAGDVAVGLGWATASVCAGVSLMAEGLLAWEVGGRFHYRYSIPGAGLIALRPLGRWMQRSWLMASTTILSVLSVIGWGAMSFPQAIAASTTAAHLVWVAYRWRAWRIQVAAEDALIEEEEQRGPSDTDETPIGTTRGTER